MKIIITIVIIFLVLPFWAAGFIWQYIKRSFESGFSCSEDVDEWLKE